MAQDTYLNFNDLDANEDLDKDYRITIADVGSPVTIMAPHGGRIEPKTSYIARNIARSRFNCYCFEGIKPDNNRCLHITSHNFDEPQALQLVSRSQMVVAVHACTDVAAKVYPGGRHEGLINFITSQIAAAGIEVANRNEKYPGLNPNNICNRSASGRGVQLEISRGVRDDKEMVDRFCDAVYGALTLVANAAGESV